MRARDEKTLERLAADYGYRAIAETLRLLSDKHSRAEHTRLRRRGIRAYLLMTHSHTTACERMKVQG